MGRREVVEIKCDRCARTEHIPASKAPTGNEPVFRGTFDGATVEYKDLCTSCKEIVTMRWDEITRVLTKASPQRDRTGKLVKIMESKSSGSPPPTPVKLSPHGTSPRS